MHQKKHTKKLPRILTFHHITILAVKKMDVADDRCVRLNIDNQPSDQLTGFSPTFFEPQLSDSPPQPSQSDEGTNHNAHSCMGSGSGGTEITGPERKLTLLALRLAILEKAASRLGALGFIWATVVLLGGFAITLEKKDFWFITVILLIEGARIFSRSHELEWQHQATWSLAAAGRSSFRALKSSTRVVARSFPLMFCQSLTVGSSRIARDVMKNAAADQIEGRRAAAAAAVPSWSFLSRHVGRLFYWLQLASASACVSLSLMRLAEQDFGYTADARTNRKSALNIFYGLALAEALLFLCEKALWEWEVSHGQLLERVAAECNLAGAPGLVSIRRFFYDAYSRCVDGSIFDGLHMDLVSFAEELLVAGSRDEQRIAAGILVNLATSHQFGDATLRKIGTSAAVMERLVEMLNWKSPDEAEVRRSAAVVVSKLAGKKRNALRVAGIPGSIESISSLLYADSEDCNLLGLLIIKKLAHDHDNCGKIGNARGLLDKIIDFSTIGTTAPAMTTPITGARVKAVKRSLQVIKMLADTTGHTGKLLRREISEIVFTVSNIRAVLQNAGDHLELQRLGIEVLTSLAMDADARERIGGTGGMVAEVFGSFLRPGVTDEGNALRVEAGEAMAMLALESRRNCERILKIGGGGAVERLVEALGDEAVGVGAARVLTNLCAHAGSEWFVQLRGVTAGSAKVLDTIMVEKSKLLEVSLGLAAQMLKFMAPEEFRHCLLRAGIKETEIVNRLVRILAKYNYPSIKVPRMRRFTVEIVIGMIKSDARFIDLLAGSRMEIELRWVSETTSELECFNVFSGSVGLSRHNVSLCSLVDTALELMGKS